MPFFRPSFTINNGDIASASYLTNAISVSSYCSSAMVILGNGTTSTNSVIQEITIGTGLALSTSGVLSTSGPNLSVTGTLQVTGAMTAFSTLGVTGAATFLSTVNITGTTTVGTLALTALSAALPVAQGGTASATAAAANQSLQPTTVSYSPSTTQAVNWASGTTFFITLGGNLTISFSNAVDGQIITVIILNSASNYTVTWPTIKWPGAISPTMTTGAHYDVYNIVYNSGVGAYFGTYVQNY